MLPNIPLKNEFTAAADRIGPYVHRTPVMTCSAINEMTGANIYFKCENFQKAGAFKFRGACNRVFSLEAADAARGVVTHSSGNHAQALALAARMRGIPAHIVLPENAPAVKIDAVKGYGGKVVLCPPTLADREKTTRAIMEETGGYFIHPYNDAGILTGQGTCAMEIIGQGIAPDIIMTSVSGGGLLSGTALAADYFAPGTRVWGAEPAGADDARRSLETGTIQPCLEPDTIADGLRASLGDVTFPIIKEKVEKILTCSEAGIVRAMKTVWERMKIVAETSGVVPLAVIMEHPEAFKGKTVAVVISGGNVDLNRLPWQA